MNKHVLEQKVEDGRSTRQIADEMGSNQSTIRRWLKRYGLRTKNATNGVKGVYRNIVCVLCGHKTERGMRLCQSCQTKVRRFRAKKAAVELLGGVCNRCGWSGGIAGFEFHHVNGDSKEFGIGSVANKSWDVIKKEIMKCELLCSCCHRQQHSGYDDEAFLREAGKYKGRILGS